MTTLVSITPVSVPVPFDARALLKRIDARIRTLRRAISHDHGDEPYWQALATDAPQAQSERATLRGVANLLNVERATSRGRIHGTRFATLDDQRAWLVTMEHFRCARAARFAQLPDDATLAKLRAGELLGAP